MFDQFGLTCKPPALRPLPRQESGNLIGAVPRTQETTMLGISTCQWARLFQKLVPDEQGCAEGPAGVTGRRLNPKIVEITLAL